MSAKKVDALHWRSILIGVISWSVAMAWSTWFSNFFDFVTDPANKQNSWQEVFLLRLGYAVSLSLVTYFVYSAMSGKRKSPARTKK